MKTIPNTDKLNRRRQISALALKIGLIAGFSALPLHAQDNENITAGSNEDEWYDPGDWADGNNTEATGSDWWDNDGWSNSENDDNDGWANSTDDDDSTSQSDYNEDSTSGTNNQAGRNPSQNRSDMQSSRNQRQNRNDMQSQRNQRQNRSDMQSRRNSQQDWSDRNSQASRNQGHSMKTVSFDGTIDGFKKVNLTSRDGNSDEHTFVRVRLNNDDARVVSLGSRLIISDLDLQKGDQISVSGRNARIDNRDVLVASSIEVDDTLFRVRKDNRPDTHTQFSIEGTVKDVSMTSLRNDSREKNLLVRLELKNGKSCVVDLGQGTTLSELDIEKGSGIRVHGKKTHVDGKSIIIARKISVDGDRTRIRAKSEGNESASNDRNESWEYAQLDSRYGTQDRVSQD